MELINFQKLNLNFFFHGFALVWNFEEILFFLLDFYLLDFCFWYEDVFFWLYIIIEVCCTDLFISSSEKLDSRKREFNILLNDMLFLFSKIFFSLFFFHFFLFVLLLFIFFFSFLSQSLFIESFSESIVPEYL